MTKKLKNPASDLSRDQLRDLLLRVLELVADDRNHEQRTNGPFASMALETNSRSESPPCPPSRIQ